MPYLITWKYQPEALCTSTYSFVPVKMKDKFITLMIVVMGTCSQQLQVSERSLLRTDLRRAVGPKPTSPFLIFPDPAKGV